MLPAKENGANRGMGYLRFCWYPSRYLRYFQMLTKIQSFMLISLPCGLLKASYSTMTRPEMKKAAIIVERLKAAGHKVLKVRLKD